MLKIRKIAAEESWPQGLRDKRARTREHKCSSLPTRTASGQARPDFFDLRRTQSVGRPSLLNSSFFGGVLSRFKVEKNTTNVVLPGAFDRLTRNPHRSKRKKNRLLENC